jgi:glycosyltransferase involved in cell wall biosynthesis
LIKISVVTAVLNRQKTVGQALDSVLSQSYPAVQSIVIDGASSDGTLTVLERFRPRLGVLISERDQSIYDALNKGIKYATGDVVGFLHADDVFEDNDVLTKVAEVFQDSAVDAVYGDLVYVQHDDISQVIRYWKSGPYSDAAISRGWMPPHPTFYVRRSIYERLGGFDSRYRIAADYDIILRFLAVGKIRAAYIPEVLVRMRSGGISNRSLKTIARKSLEDFEVLRRNKIGGAWTLLQKNISKVSQFWKL